MRKLIFILISLISFSEAQTIQYIGAPTTTVISRGNFRTDSLFYLPKRTKLPTDSGAVRYQISDSSVYYWTGVQWRRLGVHIDTSTMLLPYLRKVDTTAMLAPYLKESDTVWLSNRINLKVNISDTATMLSPYALQSDVDAAVALKVNISDTSSMLTNYIRHAGNGLTKSGQALSVDTAAMATRERVQKGIDSVATLAAAGVTSITAGTGLSGGTITTTGTISADTALVASRLRVGKVVDSLALVKQNLLTNPVTGTGTTNYVPKFTGTSTIGNSVIFDNGINVGIGNTAPIAPLHVGNRLVNNSVDPVILISRNVNDSSGSGNAHAFTDGSNVYRSGSMSYNSFDARINITGSNNMGHYAAFQAAPEYSNSGTMDEYFGFFSYIGVNSGTITHNYNNYVANPTGAGTVTNNYGLYVAAQTKGSNNYAVHLNNAQASGRYNLYVNGTAYNYLNGRLGLGTSSPATMLDVVGTGQFSGQVNLNATGQQIRFGGQGTGTQMGIFQGTNSSVMQLKDFATATNGIGINGATGEVFISTTTDAGDYKLQVSGNVYSTGTTVLAATSGNVGIGTTSPEVKLTVVDGSGYRLAMRQWSGTGMEINAWDNSFQPTIPLRLTGNYLSFVTSTTGEKIRMHANGGLKFVGQSAAPTAEAGTVYYDTDDNKLKVYNGTTWVDLH